MLFLIVLDETISAADTNRIRNNDNTIWNF